MALIFFLSILLSFDSPDLPHDCQKEYTKGSAHFRQRADGARDWHANSYNISQAIYHFENSIQCSDLEQKSAQSLLRSYHFKAMYADISDEKRKFYHNKAKVLGDSMMNKYPEDLLIKMWYVVNAGKWMQYYGLLRSAYEGMGPKIKETAHQIADKDPEFLDGIGYRLLGTIYYRAPYIPVLLTWPDKDLGIEFSKKALEVNPDNIGNLMFLGRLLYLHDRHEEAKYYLEKSLKQKPREEFLMIDRYDQMKSRMFLDKINKGIYD